MTSLTALESKRGCSYRSEETNDILPSNSAAERGMGGRMGLLVSHGSLGEVNAARLVADPVHAVPEAREHGAHHTCGEGFEAHQFALVVRGLGGPGQKANHVL